MASRVWRGRLGVFAGRRRRPAGRKITRRDRPRAGPAGGGRRRRECAHRERLQPAAPKVTALPP